MRIKSSSNYPTLYKTCHTYPAIDNHAHPLLKFAYRNDMTYENIISDADGPALQDSIHTLACYRATEQLATLLGLKFAGVTWDQVKAAARDMNYEDLCQLCFGQANIQCILIDDGLGGVAELAENYRWHDRYTTSPTKRIVRIEVVAEEIIVDLVKTNNAYELNLSPGQILERFDSRFRTAISAATYDMEVAGFKSITCYRTGLDISTSDSLFSIEEALLDAITTYQNNGDGKIRLASKAFNDHFVRMTLEIATKPVQFHTGLGDSSLLLSLATPSLMQPIIRAYPKVTFVLLHAAYPFTRETGYLVAMYQNVYVDFGEIFPQVSAEGQRAIIRQLLELCPTNKIMWSTDGHWMPETYVLGSIQAREAIYAVLNGSVERRELTEARAVEMVKNMLFDNANKVYQLNLQPILTT